jgi:hypothetical protein
VKLGVLWLALALPLAAADRRGPKLLWREPGRLSAAHWTCGPSPCSEAPTAPFQMIKRDRSATNPKVLVKDARGRTFDVKFGAKVIPECFCARYVTAVGFFNEPEWFVAEGVIEGMGAEKMRILSPGGRFTKARFQPREQADFEFLPHSEWSWRDNPFSGTRELAGLKILMMLLSNWDDKDGRPGEDSNDAVFRVTQQGRPELLYSVFDWGAALGRWGGPLRRDQSDCSGFVRDTPHFVRLSANGLEWGFQGKHTFDMKAGITVESIRWLLPYLHRITPEQMHLGFTASGATERQSACWSYAIAQRIKQLDDVAR